MEGVQQIHGNPGLPAYETLKRIIDQIPECRDILQLYHQLHHALPIPDRQALEDSVNNGMIYFRDMRVSLRLLKDFIPEFIFPILDERALIERLYHVVCVIPSFVGFDSTRVQNIQYISQVNFLNMFRDWLKDYSFPAADYIMKHDH